MFDIRIHTRRGKFELDVSIRVEQPGVLALFGRSGCGKTTLINVLAGLVKAHQARIEIGGELLEDSAANRYVPAERRTLGYVFQDARLFPHLNVTTNLLYGLRRARREHQMTFDSVVALLGLESILDRRPQQLSGGERQRVALGRALLSQPRALLLDEPLASLDAARRDEVLPYLERLRDELAIPMIYVSHQYEEVLRLATHVVLMAEGRSVAVGPVEELSLHPQLRAIIGPDAIGAVLTGAVEVVDEETGFAVVRIGDNTINLNLRGVRPGAIVRMHLHARDLVLATVRPDGLSVRNVLIGAISRIVEDDADTDLVYVDLGGAQVLARVTRAASVALSFRQGLRVWVLVKSVSIRGHSYVGAAAKIASGHGGRS